MEIASITYKTELSEILNNDTVEDLINPLMTKVKSACQSRDGVIWNNIRNGGLSDKILVDGSPKYYSEATQCSSQYRDVVDQITSLVGTSMAYTSEREILELKTLRQKLFDRNTEVQRNISTLNSNYENRQKGDEQQENLEYDNYYGINGHVTLAKAELAENERKIYEVNVRLSKVNGGSKAYTSSSDADKKKINIQNARCASDSEWGELPSLRDDARGIKVYRYVTPDGVVIEKTVKDGKTAYYEVKDNSGYFFDSDGNIISRETVRGINHIIGFNESSNLWTNNGGNYSYNKPDDGCSEYVATGSDGKPLYYVVHNGDETIYYNSNFERLSKGQVEKIVGANGLTPITVAGGSSGNTTPTEPPTEPPCDPTEPPTGPATTEPPTSQPSTEPSTVPPDPPTTEPPESGSSTHTSSSGGEHGGGGSNF